MSTGLIFLSAESRSNLSLACCSTAITNASCTWLFSANSLAEKRKELKLERNVISCSKFWGSETRASCNHSRPYCIDSQAFQFQSWTALPSFVVIQIFQFQTPWCVTNYGGWSNHVNCSRKSAYFLNECIGFVCSLSFIKAISWLINIHIYNKNNSRW